ncbi:MAG: alpha/beta hydrolase [Pseudomonadota bacterium]
MTRLVVLHGAYLTGRSMAPLTQCLSEAMPDASITAPDLLGHGIEACAPDVSLGTQAAALADSFMADRPVIVGFGFGARVALQALRDWAVPPAGLVLIGAGLGPAWGPSTVAGLAARGQTPAPRAAFLEPLIAGWFASPSSGNVRSLARIAGQMTAGAFERVLAATRVPAGRIGGNRRVPTLILHGAADCNRRPSEAQALAELLEGEIEVFLEGGHALPFEMPGAVAGRIAGWHTRAFAPPAAAAAAE